MRTYCLKITISREELKSLIQSKPKSAVEAAECEFMNGQIEVTIGDVLTVGCYATTDSIQNFAIMFDEDGITDMIHSGLLNKTLNENFERWSHLGEFLKAPIYRIVKNPGFIARVAAFVKYRETSTAEDKLILEPPVTKKTPSPHDRSPSASVGLTS